MSYAKQQRTSRCRTKSHRWAPWQANYKLPGSLYFRWRRFCPECGASEARFTRPEGAERGTSS